MKRNRHKEFQYTKLQLAKNSDDDDDAEETELFIRKAPYKEIPTEEKLVEEGDTLQSLSIRYHCPISELKRLNNIHKENEIFARNTIKVPARPITKILAGVHMSGKSSPEANSSAKAAATNVIDTTILEDKLINLNSSEPTVDDFNAVIFNSNINKTCDIEGVQTVNDDVIEEEVQLLPNRPVAQEISPTVNRLGCNGADADISWIALIICIIILIFAVPLIYVFYIAEHPEEYHHKMHLNNAT